MKLQQLKYINQLNKKQLDQLLNLLKVKFKGQKNCVFEYTNYNDKFIEVSVKYPETMDYIWISDYCYTLLDRTPQRDEMFYKFMFSIFGEEYKKDYTLFHNNLKKDWFVEQIINQ